MVECFGMEKLIYNRDAKQFWKKTVSTPKLELISEIAFNSMKQSFALKNFRPIFPILCSMHRQLQLGLNTVGSLPLKTKNLHYGQPFHSKKIEFNRS